MGNIGKGIIAGFVATLILSALMMAKAAMGMLPQFDVIAILAGMVNGSPAIGWAMHFIIGTIIWGVLFAWLYAYLPGKGDWLKGVVFGVGAWILMMVVQLPMAGQGLFGMALGPMVPVMTLILHIIYGAVLGAVFGWLPNQEAGQIPSESSR